MNFQDTDNYIITNVINGTKSLSSKELNEMIDSLSVNDRKVLSIFYINLLEYFDRIAQQSDLSFENLVSLGATTTILNHVKNKELALSDDMQGRLNSNIEERDNIYKQTVRLKSRNEKSFDEMIKLLEFKQYWLLTDINKIIFTSDNNTAILKYIGYLNEVAFDILKLSIDKSNYQFANGIAASIAVILDQIYGIARDDEKYSEIKNRIEEIKHQELTNAIESNNQNLVKVLIDDSKKAATI